MNYKSSEVRSKGQKVTTYHKNGSKGIGYKMVDGKVYQITGSYFAVDAEKAISPMVSFIEDKGEGYLRAFRVDR